MSPSYIRANERYAWHGQSLLITNALHLLRQPPIESLKDGIPERLSALVETLRHH
jgi:hypothetical protein